MKQTPEQLRKRELAAIHASRKQLALDEDTYRDLLASVTGKRSAGEMDAAGRQAVLERMRAMGAGRAVRQRVGRHPGTPHNLTCEPMLQKIEALLTELKAPWSYADAIARQMFRIQRVAWLREGEQLRAVIAALYYEHAKRNTLAFIDDMLAKLDWDEDALRQRMPKLRKDWRRVRVQRCAVARLLNAPMELLKAEEDVPSC